MRQTVFYTVRVYLAFLWGNKNVDFCQDDDVSDRIEMGCWAENCWWNWSDFCIYECVTDKHAKATPRRPFLLLLSSNSGSSRVYLQCCVRIWDVAFLKIMMWEREWNWEPWEHFSISASLRKAAGKNMFINMFQTKPHTTHNITVLYSVGIFFASLYWGDRTEIIDRTNIHASWVKKTSFIVIEKYE